MIVTAALGLWAPFEEEGRTELVEGLVDLATEEIALDVTVEEKPGNVSVEEKPADVDTEEALEIGALLELRDTFDTEEELPTRH